MKNLLFIIALLISFCTQAQTFEYADTNSGKKVLIITQNGGEFIGKIIKQDAKEVLIYTKKLGEVSIPKYQIKEIKEIENDDINVKGDYKGNQVFATRYLGTTNALSVGKGENYVKYSLIGPDVNFGVTDNLTIGVMTSWIALPIVVTAKYSHQINENTHVAGGLMVGNLGWASLVEDVGFNLALVPFGAITKGTRRNNINFALGYGKVWIDGIGAGAVVGSVGGMSKIGRTTSFVFDSMILGLASVSGTSIQGGLTTTPGFGLILTPGLRFQSKEDAAFQFGFSLGASDGGVSPIPLPRFAWFRKF